MMRPLSGPLAVSVCTVVLVLSGGPARAQDLASLEPAFGATIVSTHPDGRSARLWLNRDRTYSAQGRKGQKSSGVWKLKGGKLCLSQRKPITLPLQYCKTLPRVRVGATWSDIAVTGERVQNRLAPRR